MTRKVSTEVATEAHAEGAQAESARPTDQKKRRASPSAAPPPKAEPTSKGGGPSRRDQLIRMLSTRSGTDLAAISAKFGWLPHTTRAALSGLRKAGHAVVTEKRADGKPTRYRIAAQNGGASPGDGLPSVTGASAPEFPSYPNADVTAPTPAPVDTLTTAADKASDPARSGT